MRFLRTCVAALALTTASAYAETIQVEVHGMVCAFCCEGIEKAFKKRPEIESMCVDLKSKKVTLCTKENAQLDDKTVRDIITNAGYTAKGIHRS